jgi:ribosomal-protein-serine acetyltransferase
VTSDNRVVFTDRPPERLENDIVVLVRAALDHLDGLQAAIETSYLELQPWMDWIGDAPQSVDATREYLATRAKLWDDGEDFGFSMLDPVADEVIGNCALMTRQGPATLEIGYWVRSDRAAAGVATAAAALLTQAGLAMDGIETIEIHHDAANRASGRIPEKLGYRETSRYDVERGDPRQAGTNVIWQITREARP